MKVKDLKERLNDFPDDMEVVVSANFDLPPRFVPQTNVEGRIKLKEDIVAVLEPDDEFECPEYYYDNLHYSDSPGTYSVHRHPYDFPGRSLPKKKVLMLDIDTCIYHISTGMDYKFEGVKPNLV